MKKQLVQPSGSKQGSHGHGTTPLQPSCSSEWPKRSAMLNSAEISRSEIWLPLIAGSVHNTMGVSCGPMSSKIIQNIIWRYILGDTWRYSGIEPGPARIILIISSLPSHAHWHQDCQRLIPLMMEQVAAAAHCTCSRSPPPPPPLPPTTTTTTASTRTMLKQVELKQKPLQDQCCNKKSLAHTFRQATSFQTFPVQCHT